MDHLGLTFGLTLLVLWLVVGFAIALVFGKASHDADEVSRQLDSEFETWAAERDQRVRRAEFRHHTRYARRP